MSNQVKLQEHILHLSDAATWEVAKREWELASIYHSDVPETCPCGQTPIIEICVIRNRRNGNETEVGNQCVKNFLNLPSDKLFASLRRFRSGASNSLSLDLIDYAYERGIIRETDRDFYRDIRLKKKLSSRQRTYKEDLNNRIIDRISRK